MARRPDALILSRWLFVVAAMVIAVAVVGAITRLTESGLSITEWRPVSGILPPLSAAAWDAAFAQYRTVPQYGAIHADMTLAQFKVIFFWEWFHRLLARAVGLAYALPLLWFWVRGRIPAGYKPRLLALFALGLLQAVVGWWMVRSGLFQGVAVSHFRLAVHLSLALTLMSGLVWTALDLRHGGRARMTAGAAAVLAVLGVQIMFGAFVAGLRAGKVATDWPAMAGALVPAMDWSLTDPWFVHWVHRWWAWVAVGALIWMARRVRSDARRVSVAIHSAFGVQILLGIATVMTGVHLHLAAAHQAVGAILLGVTVWGAHVMGRYSNTRLEMRG